MPIGPRGVLNGCIKSPSNEYPESALVLPFMVSVAAMSSPRKRRGLRNVNSIWTFPVSVPTPAADPSLVNVNDWLEGGTSSNWANWAWAGCAMAIAANATIAASQGRGRPEETRCIIGAPECEVLGEGEKGAVSRKD